jgi:hypothetical protein
MHPMLEQALRQRIFWITRRIAIGQFATAERAAWLREQGVSHVLNVGECGSVVAASDFGFCEVVDVSVEDLVRIPNDLAVHCIKVIHGVMLQPDTKLYMHCIAGQNRSPTILWLYLMACGINDEDAKHMIASRSPDSVPGHGALIDSELIATIRRFGQAVILPLRDASFLEPAY